MTRRVKKKPLTGEELGKLREFVRRAGSNKVAGELLFVGEATISRACGDPTYAVSENLRLRLIEGIGRVPEPALKAAKPKAVKAGRGKCEARQLLLRLSRVEKKVDQIAALIDEHPPCACREIGL